MLRRPLPRDWRRFHAPPVRRAGALVALLTFQEPLLILGGVELRGCQREGDGQHHVEPEQQIH